MIIVLRRFHRLDMQNNRWITFVFGDNDTRSGYGGQARACRGEPNSLGIRTKKLPNMMKNSFYSDSDYFDNITKINEDIDAVKTLLLAGNLVAFPKDGFGTGSALLRSKAPKTYLHLNNTIRTLLLAYRLPEVTEDTVVKAFNTNFYKVVPFRIAPNFFERSLNAVQQMLTGLGVEEVDPRVLRHLVRDLYALSNDIDSKKVRIPYTKDIDSDDDDE